MSETQEPTNELPDVRHIDVSIQKCKVGPITARYGNGGYVDVDPRTTDHEPSRKAILGLDNSHNRDYKVAYASDTLIVINGDRGSSHDELRGALKANNLWSEQYREIEVPFGADKWQAAFATPTEFSGRFDLLSGVLERKVPRDLDYREGPNDAHGFIPVE